MVVLRAKALGYHDGKSTGNSLKPSGHQKDQGCGTSDGCQRVNANITASHHGIYQIVKLLENISEISRNHKCQDQAHGIAPCHIICHAELLLHFLIKTVRSS